LLKRLIATRSVSIGFQRTAWDGFPRRRKRTALQTCSFGKPQSRESLL